MNIFKSSSFEWWQIGFLKLAMLVIGITIGSTWPQVFVGYAIYLLVVGVILGIYLAYIWLK